MNNGQLFQTWNENSQQRWKAGQDRRVWIQGIDWTASADVLNRVPISRSDRGMQQRLLSLRRVLQWGTVGVCYITIWNENTRDSIISKDRKKCFGGLAHHEPAISFHVRGTQGSLEAIESNTKADQLHPLAVTKATCDDHIITSQFYWCTNRYSRPKWMGRSWTYLSTAPCHVRLNVEVLLKGRENNRGFVFGDHLLTETGLGPRKCAKKEIKIKALKEAISEN